MVSLRRRGRGRWRIAVISCYKRFLLHMEGIHCKECPHQGTAFLMPPPSRWQPSPEDGLEHRPARSTCWLGGNVSGVVCVLWNTIQISKGYCTAITFRLSLKGEMLFTILLRILLGLLPVGLRIRGSSRAHRDLTVKVSHSVVSNSLRVFGL